MDRWEYASLLLTNTYEYQRREPDPETGRYGDDGVGPWEREEQDGASLDRIVPTAWWRGPSGVTDEWTVEGAHAVDYLNRIGRDGWELASSITMKWVMSRKRSSAGYWYYDVRHHFKRRVV